MQFINLMRNKLKPKEVANALDANTSAVADINALIGSTPLPQGETITHMLSNIGGVNYSNNEQDTGVKWVNGKSVYQKTITANISGTFTALWDNSGIDTLINSYGAIVNPNGQVTAVNGYGNANNYNQIYISDGTLALLANETHAGGTINVTILYTKN